MISYCLNNTLVSTHCYDQNMIHSERRGGLAYLDNVQLGTTFFSLKACLTSSRQTSCYLIVVMK